MRLTDPIADMLARMRNGIVIGVLPIRDTLTFGSWAV